MSSEEHNTLCPHELRKLQPVSKKPVAFAIADLHLGDEALCRNQGRPFENANTMATEIARRWNDLVDENDVVYVLGDLGHLSNIGSIRHLPGRKHLIAGNGDNLEAICRSGIFLSVGVARWLPGLLLTHVPVHPSQLREGMVNVHGHTHSRTIPDRRYRCVWTGVQKGPR